MARGNRRMALDLTLRGSRRTTSAWRRGGGPESRQRLHPDPRIDPRARGPAPSDGA